MTERNPIRTEIQHPFDESTRFGSFHSKIQEIIERNSGDTKNGEKVSEYNKILEFCDRFGNELVKDEPQIHFLTSDEVVPYKEEMLMPVVGKGPLVSFIDTLKTVQFLQYLEQKYPEFCRSHWENLKTWIKEQEISVDEISSQVGIAPDLLTEFDNEKIEIIPMDTWKKIDEYLFGPVE